MDSDERSGDEATGGGQEEGTAEVDRKGKYKARDDRDPATLFSQTVEAIYDRGLALG